MVRAIGVALLLAASPIFLLLGGCQTGALRGPTQITASGSASDTLGGASLHGNGHGQRPSPEVRAAVPVHGRTWQRGTAPAARLHRSPVLPRWQERHTLNAARPRTPALGWGADEGAAARQIRMAPRLEDAMFPEAAFPDTVFPDKVFPGKAFPDPAPREGADRLVAPADAATNLGGGMTVPSARSRGIGGSRLRGSIAFLAPTTANVGLFYAINDRWTAGLVGQRLEQERSVGIDGQLIDPNDLSSFIPGFSIRERTTSLSFGPFVQYRIFTEQGVRPLLHIGAYSLEWGTITSARTEYTKPNLILNKEGDAVSEGDSADKYRTVYFSASKRLPIFNGSSVIRGVRAYGGAGYGARTGKRYAVAATGQGDPRIRVIRQELTRHSFVGWVGTEAALPLNCSIFGEMFTGDECEAGYAAGLRWMSPIGITFTFGVSNCFEAVPQRALDLVYFPGGVGGQPSLVSGGGGLDGGGLGQISGLDEDDRRSRRGRGRSSRRRAPARP